MKWMLAVIGILGMLLLAAQCQQSPQIRGPIHVGVPHE